MDAINLEQLGVSAILVAYLWHQTRELRNDLNAEREYTRQLQKDFHDALSKTQETMSKLHSVVQALKDSLR